MVAQRYLARHPDHPSKVSSRALVQARTRLLVHDTPSDLHFYGADDRIRTGDPHLGKVMLYQLSYVRMSGSP